MCSEIRRLFFKADFRLAFTRPDTGHKQGCSSVRRPVTLRVNLAFCYLEPEIRRFFRGQQERRHQMLERDRLFYERPRLGKLLFIRPVEQGAVRVADEPADSVDHFHRNHCIQFSQ